MGTATWSELIDASSTQIISGPKSFSAITNVTNTTQSSSKDTGALIVDGGVGIEKNCYVGGNLYVVGDLTVDGLTTTINSTVLEVEDANITINNGGNQVSANLLAGLTVEMSDATNVTIIYSSALASRWKIGDLGSEEEILTANHTQLASNKSFKASTTFVVDETDITKKMKFDASSIGTGTTNTVKLLNMNGTLIFSGTKAAINAHGRYASAIWYATDEKKYYGDDGINLLSLGGGGSGITLVWRNDGQYSLQESTYFNQLAYEFVAGETQQLPSFIRIPDEYAPGSQIFLDFKIFSPTGSGNILIKSLATLIRGGVDQLSSTTNQRTSTNSAQTIAAANFEYDISVDLSSAIGEINGVAINPGDTILFYLYRDTDTNPDLALFAPSSAKIRI